MYWLVFGVCSVMILITMGTLIFQNFSRPSSLQRILNYNGIATLLTLIAWLIEINYRDIGTHIICLKTQHLSLIIYILCMVAFSVDYSQIKTPKVFKIFSLTYGIVQTFLITISFTDAMYITNMHMDYDGFYPRLIYSFGPLMYAEYICSAVMGLLGFYVTLIHHRKKEIDSSKDYIFVAVNNIVCVVGMIVDLIFQNHGYSITWLFVFISWILLNFVIFKYRMFDPMQMAKDDILDAIDDGYMVVDLADNISYFNEKAKKIFPELEFDATHPVVVEKLTALDKKDTVIGDRRYNVSVNPFYDKNAYKGKTIWINDVTDEYNSRQRLIELKEEAEKANRAKSVFLANMSHEIRTPMNAIVGMTELILHENINSNVEENAKNIKSASNSLLSIINGILDFSKIENGNMEMSEEDYNIGYVLKDISNMINLKLKDKNVELIVHVKDTIPSVLRGDETHIRQIFTNILTNAVKYTKRGYIRMNVDWEKIKTKKNNNSEANSFCNAVIKVSIEDTGCGIKPESIPVLFDSFQRADMIKNRTIEGTGLGLAICKRLVESMGGEITVKSSYGVGSVFSFYIYQKIGNEAPLGDFDRLELQEDREVEKTFIAPLAKILVVDDNATNLKVAQGILTMYQVRVDTASSGKECLEKISKHNYHMIFMDQMMPELDGIETTKIIRKDDDPDIRNMIVIAVTANAITGTREMFLQNGFQEYISKPINISSVENILKKFLPADIIKYVNRKNDYVDYSNLNIKIPYVNVEQGLTNYGNDMGKYLQILKFINDDGPMQINRIKEYLEGEHYRKYVFEVHSLKGLMAGIGANQLSEFARLQEFAGRDGNIDIIKRESGLLLEQYATLLENIKAVLNDAGILREEIIPIREEELTWEEFANMLHSLQGSIDLLEQGEAARKIDNLLTYPFDVGIRKQLMSIKRLINEFEYDSAADIIKLLLS